MGPNEPTVVNTPRKAGPETKAMERADVAAAALIEGKDDSIELVRDLLTDEKASHLETRNRYAKERARWMWALMLACGVSSVASAGITTWLGGGG